MNTPSRYSHVNQSMHSTSKILLFSLSQYWKNIKCCWKIINSSTSFKNERCSKLDKLDNVIATTGDKLLEYSEECHNRFGNIREQLSKLYQQIEQQNQYFDSVYEEKCNTWSY